MSVSGETGDVSVSDWVVLDRHSRAVLGGNGLVTSDVIVVVLVWEMEQQVIVTLRYHCKHHSTRSYDQPFCYRNKCQHGPYHY